MLFLCLERRTANIFRLLALFISHRRANIIHNRTIELCFTRFESTLSNHRTASDIHHFVWYEIVSCTSRNYRQTANQFYAIFNCAGKSCSHFIHYANTSTSQREFVTRFNTNSTLFSHTGAIDIISKATKTTRYNSQICCAHSTFGASQGSNR